MKTLGESTIIITPILLQKKHLSVECLILGLLDTLSSSCLICWLGLMLLFASNLKLPISFLLFQGLLFSEGYVVTREWGFATKMFQPGLYVSHNHK